MLRSLLLLGAFGAFAVTNAFSPIAGSLSLRRALPSVISNRFPLSLLSVSCGPRPIHTKFTVEKATEEQKAELGVENWGVWSTKGSAKYIVGKRSPLKVYDCNELSYIISGKMEIIPEETGEAVLVQAGDFVTFPDGFPCYWHVIEEINKHYYIY
mmetsp:Transcript_61530/g.99499  ORF Transcript_61530/g.99499 Transcript_61530/m.99499 type:complete len:155 (-) Transcript_61530:60-524(-)